MEHSDVMAKAFVQDPMGPGFESQIPQCLCIIFLQLIPCSIQGAAYHASSLDHLPDGPRPDLVAQNEGLWWDQVSACMENQQSQTRLA